MLCMHVVYLLLAYLRRYLLSHLYVGISKVLHTVRLLANFLAVLISNYGRRRKTSIVIANAVLMDLVQLAITVQIE